MIEKILSELAVLQKTNYEAYETATWNNDKIAYINASNAFSNAMTIVQEVAKEYGTKHLPAEYDWIPFEMREMDEEEKRCNGVQEGYILDCPLPDEDEEILVTYSNGTVDVDIFMRDGNECYLDSGNDLVTEAIAWRKKPAPYQKGE